MAKGSVRKKGKKSMNVYAHATRESKKAAGRLLDKITG